MMTVKEDNDELKNMLKEAKETFSSLGSPLAKAWPEVKKFLESLKKDQLYPFSISPSANESIEISYQQQDRQAVIFFGSVGAYSLKLQVSSDEPLFCDFDETSFKKIEVLVKKFLQCELFDAASKKRLEKHLLNLSKKVLV